MNKQFKLSKSDIMPLVLGIGGCLATDRITVDGCEVGYMYKEAPSNAGDSGLRFSPGMKMTNI